MRPSVQPTGRIVGMSLGRVIGRTFRGGHVRKLMLDAPVTMSWGSRYGIAYRRADDPTVIESREVLVERGEHDVVVLSDREPPVPMALSPFMFGPMWEVES